jgi:hypothetical protein
MERRVTFSTPGASGGSGSAGANDTRPRQAASVCASSAPGASTTYLPVPPPVVPPLPPPVPPPGDGEGLAGDWEGPEGEVVVPDREGGDDDGLGRSYVPSLAHPPARSISTRLMTASGIGDVIQRIFRQERVMCGPPSRHPEARCASLGPGHPPGLVSQGAYLSTIGADDKSKLTEIQAVQEAWVGGRGAAWPPS